MAKWSTTGFSLQWQSLINQANGENRGNHQLEDIVLREMKDTDGELTVWTWTSVTICICTPVQGSTETYSSLGPNQRLNFACRVQVLVYLNFLIYSSWRMICLGNFPLGDSENAKSTCPWQLGSTFSSPALVIEEENIEKYGSTPLWTLLLLY